MSEKLMPVSLSNKVFFAVPLEYRYSLLSCVYYDTSDNTIWLGFEHEYMMNNFVKENVNHMSQFSNVSYVCRHITTGEKAYSENDQMFFIYSLFLIFW